MKTFGEVVSMWKKSILWHKILALLLVITFFIPVLAACGDNKEETSPPTSPATLTMTPTDTPVITPTPTATSVAGPVKLGAINSWSGPASMSGLFFADSCIKVVEQQVKDQGGILGGRDVTVIKYDNRASVAEAQAGVKKLVESDKVSALLFGGTSAAEMLAVAAAADQYPILFCAFSITDYKGKIALQMGPSSFALENAIMYSVTKIEKAKTIAFLGSDMGDTRERIAHMKESCSAAGIKTVYENYASIDTADFTPYLSKIKYEKPDYLYLEFASSEPYITIAKQVKELGGLGDTKVGGNPAAQSATKQPGADGWYLTLVWFPGSTYPGSIKFENDFKTIIGRAPDPNHVYFYMSLWTAIHAIELAGTDADRDAIIQAAHSGKLGWETPAGFALWSGKDQFSNLGYQLAHVEGGKLVQVPVTE
jgi:ABC-type branched-subunit amino acid transport system substrate-binding protein